jgi:mannosyltransferase
VVGVISCVWFAGGATESLWVDELHTSWTVSGEWSDVAQRARAGNQSPLYFWVLYGLAGTLGNISTVSQAWLLRFPSLLCSAAVVVVCLWLVARTANDRRSLPVVGVAMVLWLWLDRVQLFYATEARVYAWVQLVSLLGWVVVGQLSATHLSPNSLRWRIWGWCGLSGLLVFLHITTALAVAFQVVWGSMLMLSHTRPVRRHWVVAVSLVASWVLAALLLSSRVWEQRQQWQSFAGDASWSTLGTLFPLAAFAVPLAVARLVDLCLPSHSQQPTWVGFSEQPQRFRGLWWLATAGPWLSAGLITALDIAPVFHRRFVIVSAVPLVMLAAVELACIRRSSLRWMAACGVTLVLVGSQGTWDNWRAGQWYGWQRWEGWRQAAVALSAQSQSEDQVWCASGLVEAAGAQLPLDENLSVYLSFPLRGTYRVVDAHGTWLEPRGLLLSGEAWAEQLLAAPARTTQSESSQVVEELQTPTTLPSSPQRQAVKWIVYRGSRAGLERRLEQMLKRLSAAHESGGAWEIDEPQSFGLVHVVRVTNYNPDA